MNRLHCNPSHRTIVSSINALGNKFVPVVFMRHGESTWNQQHKFIGMADTPLTPQGVVEAHQAGRLLVSEGFHFDCVYTSLLRRATKTTWIVMEELGLEWAPVHKDWRLNERSYGALVGRSKKQCIEEYGKDQVKLWRRSWDHPPPEMTKDNQYWPGHDPRYRKLGICDDDIPLTDSLKNVTKRTTAFWNECVIPMMKAEQRILIVGHENGLRSLLKYIDNISDEDIIDIDIPRATPLLYHFDMNTLKSIPFTNHVPLLTGRYISKNGHLESILDRDRLTYSVTS
eukprot:gene9308-19322_t